MTREDFAAGFPVVVELDVQWGDMDAFGHVNNVIYFRYFEHARIAYMHKVLNQGVFDTQKVFPVLAETACRYKRPLTFPDRITVGCTITEIQEHGFAQEYEIYSEAQLCVTTTGMGRVVLLEKQSQQKFLISPELNHEIKTLEKLV